MDDKAMYKLTYGLFLLTAQDNGKDNGCIINTAIQIANIFGHLMNLIIVTLKRLQVVL